MATDNFRTRLVKSMATLLNADYPSLPIAPVGDIGNKADVPTPDSMGNTMYAPGWPINPMRQSKDEKELPREIDYPLNVNVTLTPRTGYGLMPFSALSEAYNSVSEIQVCTNLILRALQGFIPRIRRMERAYEQDTWPAKPSGLCAGWCPVKTCPHYKDKKR